MKKLILIIAALMLMSCCGESTSSEDRYYNDSVTILNDSGEVIKVYENVKAVEGSNSERVYIRTRDGKNFCVIGGIMVVKYGR